MQMNENIIFFGMIRLEGSRLCGLVMHMKCGMGGFNRHTPFNTFLKT